MGPGSKRTRIVVAVIALAGMLAITSGEISGQGKKPRPQQTAPAQTHVSRTKLQVRRVNGQIAYWADLMTTTSPEVTLRYSTTEPGATQAEWHLLDKPFPSDPRKSAAEGPHLLGGRGLGAVPPNGEFEVFEISLAPFPRPLAKTPRVFWVIVVTKNAQNQIVGVASAPVKIVYKKAPLGSKEHHFTDFTGRR